MAETDEKGREESDDELAELRDRLRSRRGLRDRVLISVYRLTDGRAGPGVRCELDQIALDLGADLADVEPEARRLGTDGLLHFPAMGPLVELTAEGVDHVEEMIEPTSNPMDLLSVVEARQVEAFTRQVDHALETGQVEASDETLAEIRDLLQVLQLQAKRPRRGVVRAILSVLGQLLISASGAGVYELARQIPVIL